MKIPSDIMTKAEAAYDALGRGSDADARVIARAILAERKRCIGHVYGQAGSDNVAQRTVEAIEAGQ